MVRLAAVEKQQDTTDELFRDMKKSIDDLPKKLLTWLLIFGGIIVVLQFLGPSVRKVMGLAATQSHNVFARRNADVSTIPPL